MKKYLIISCVAAGLLTFSSCDSFLDINQDPNNITDDKLTADMVYPAAELVYASYTGDQLRYLGGFLCEHYMQAVGSTNYQNLSAFNLTDLPDAIYSAQYIRSLANLATVRDKASESGNWATFLAATVMRAATFQLLADCWGEAPYSESLNGEISAPAFDSDKEIYAGIIAELNNAISRISDTNQSAATSFLVPNGKAADWIKVANALKLKILMREHNAVDVSDALEALINEDNFPTADVQWAGCWANASGKANPFFSEEMSSWGRATHQCILNVALGNTMSAYNDARLPVYFTPGSGASGVFYGSISGAVMNTAPDPYNQNILYATPIVNYDTPVSFISLAEIEFFLAEYYADNGNISEAQTHYQNAIEASFSSAGVSGADAAIKAWPLTADNYQEAIGVQKWVHLSGVNPYEAWCELRRLGYPAFAEVTGGDLYDGTSVQTDNLQPGYIYTPAGVYTQVGANKLIQRFDYPLSIKQINPNVPTFKGFTTPLFWAK